MGKDEEAQQVFDRALKIYTQHCNKEDIETARILGNIAKIYLEKNQLDDAERFVKKSLKILHNHKHVSAYTSLELLGEIYLKKSILPLYAKNEEERLALKNQSLDAFNEALSIVKQHFPADSTHVEKIGSKIRNIKN